MERAPLDASQVANHILRKFFEGNMEITPLKLQNIIYIVYGYYLIITKKRLFDEPILAWDLGSVVPSIYYFYKGKNRIKNKEYIFINEKYDKEYRIFPKYCDLNYVIFPYPVESELYNEETDLYFCSVVNMVYKFYKWKSNKELVEILHQKGSPWYKVYNRNNILASGKNRPLLDEDICKQLEPLLIKNLEHKDRNFFDIVFSMVKKVFTNILLYFYYIFTIFLLLIEKNRNFFGFSVCKGWKGFLLYFYPIFYSILPYFYYILEI